MHRPLLLLLLLLLLQRQLLLLLPSRYSTPISSNWHSINGLRTPAFVVRRRPVPRAGLNVLWSLTARATKTAIMSLATACEPGLLVAFPSSSENNGHHHPAPAPAPALPPWTDMAESERSALLQLLTAPESDPASASATALLASLAALQQAQAPSPSGSDPVSTPRTEPSPGGTNASLPTTLPTTLTLPQPASDLVGTKSCSSTTPAAYQTFQAESRVRPAPEKEERLTSTNKRRRTTTTSPTPTTRASTTTTKIKKETQSRTSTTVHTNRTSNSSGSSVCSSSPSPTRTFGTATVAPGAAGAAAGANAPSFPLMMGMPSSATATTPIPQGGRIPAPKRPPQAAGQRTAAGKPFPVIDTSAPHSSMFIHPDTSGLTKREARLVKNRAAAFLSRQRRREQFDELDHKSRALARLVWILLTVIASPGANANANSDNANSNNAQSSNNSNSNSHETSGNGGSGSTANAAGNAVNGGTDVGNEAIRALAGEDPEVLSALHQVVEHRGGAITCSEDHGGSQTQCAACGAGGSTSNVPSPPPSAQEILTPLLSSPPTIPDSTARLQAEVVTLRAALANTNKQEGMVGSLPGNGAVPQPVPPQGVAQGVPSGVPVPGSGPGMSAMFPIMNGMGMPPPPPGVVPSGAVPGAVPPIGMSMPMWPGMQGMNGMNGMHGMHGMNGMNGMNSMGGMNGMNGMNMPFLPPPWAALGPAPGPTPPGPPQQPNIGAFKAPGRGDLHLTLPPPSTIMPPQSEPSNDVTSNPATSDHHGSSVSGGHHDPGSGASGNGGASSASERRYPPVRAASVPTPTTPTLQSSCSRAEPLNSTTKPRSVTEPTLHLSGFDPSASPASDAAAMGLSSLSQDDDQEPAERTPLAAEGQGNASRVDTTGLEDNELSSAFGTESLNWDEESLLSVCLGVSSSSDPSDPTTESLIQDPDPEPPEKEEAIDSIDHSGDYHQQPHVPPPHPQQLDFLTRTGSHEACSSTGYERLVAPPPQSIHLESTHHPAAAACSSSCTTGFSDSSVDRTRRCNHCSRSVRVARANLAAVAIGCAFAAVWRGGQQQQPLHQ